MRNGTNFMAKKQKNKIDKKDVIIVGILAAAFIVFVGIVTRGTFYYGSTLDWESQHSVIPEYFRMLFYKTHDLLPDFAFNLGSGQNIYNFSYYGLLSPITLLSYLFPFVRMIDYLVAANIFAVILASVLFYFWLRKRQNAGYMNAFLASMTFMFATCLSFHSHRHVMFINYMPFMIMGLFGVDAKLNDGKGFVLSLSVFAMIMTSYYYSVGGIVGLVIYGVFKWIKKTEKPSFKLFFKEGFAFLAPIFVGIMCAAIILLPTAHVIFSSRGETFNTITWKDLIVPSINIGYMLYETYGIGLTAVALCSIVDLLFKKREYLFLGLVFVAMLTFPIVNYVLNAGMYVDAKSFIPMLPLVVYAIYLFIDDAFKKKIDWRRLFVAMLMIALLVVYKGEYVSFFLLDLGILASFVLAYIRFDKKWLLAIPIVLLPVTASLSTSLGDELVIYDKTVKLKKEFGEILRSITENDDSMYRISNAKTILRDVNNLYGNIDYNTSTLYSSTYNLDYNRFYYDEMNNPIQNRNRVITSPTANLLFLMFSGNKYLIDNQADYFGYDLYKVVDGTKIYRNEDVFPLMYARSNVMSTSDFDKLSHPERAVALLYKVIAGSQSNGEYEPKVEQFTFDERDITTKNIEVTEENGVYSFDADEKSRMYYKIPEEYQNKIVFVRFKMLESASCRDGDTSVYIDNVKNKLTCSSWKYHNQNYDFDYVLANRNKTEYEMEFVKGHYRISNIELYALDYEDIRSAKADIDEFNFDMDKTKGDVIFGNISVSDDGHFVTSLPYDEGFQVFVDGKEVNIEKVNTAFLGFEIKRGMHEVKIEYRAPLKKEAMLISSAGFIILGICTFKERKRTTK